MQYAFPLITRGLTPRIIEGTLLLEEVCDAILRLNHVANLLSMRSRLLP